jgi:AraC family transcriptional regulator of adaptative response / methylphosphotriester-DNA alkyltransferase methyltransferase
MQAPALSERLRATTPGTGVSTNALRVVSGEMPEQRPATVKHRTSLFEEACAIVAAEYASDISLDDIARRVASSRRQLQRAYAEIGRTTFRDHLTEVRMQRAAELLASRGLTVREVAHRVGYRQPAQFAKAFRRHHGHAPSDYRARQLHERRPQRTGVAAIAAAISNLAA